MAAIESARDDLQAAQLRDPEVKRVVAELKYHRQRNHFAARIRASMGESS